MTVPVKIVLISFAAVLLITGVAAFSQPSSSATDVALVFGIIAFFGGLLQVFVGLLLLFLTDKRYAQGCLLSGGLLMLIGFFTCTGSLNFL
jgi:uncharacterized membrane protein HdeD (DUF308 family)